MNDTPASETPENLGAPALRCGEFVRPLCSGEREDYHDALNEINRLRLELDRLKTEDRMWRDASNRLTARTAIAEARLEKQTTALRDLLAQADEVHSYSSWFAMCEYNGTPDARETARTLLLPNDDSATPRCISKSATD